jgi:hypothetical protein
MKRKHIKKLRLHRETLHRLEPSYLGLIAGALPRTDTGVTNCLTKCASQCCPNDGGTDSFWSCFATCGVCSAGCATGGACTL